jgi:hypothetical protein
MLPEAQHGRLRQGKIPRARTGRPPSYLLHRRLSSYLNRRVRIDDVIHALSRLRAVTILRTSFSGYLFEHGGIYVVEKGKTLRYDAEYANQSGAPILVEVEQALGDAERRAEVLFAPYARFSYSVEAEARPGDMYAHALVRSPLGWTRYDYVSERFTLAVMRLLKPVSEYPVDGADNVVLDVAYRWSDGSSVYPSELPPGLSFTNMGYEYLSGFVEYGGRMYKDPNVDNVVRVRATINNGTGGAVSVSHYGLPLSVLYEDDRHVSQIDAPVSFPSFDLGDGRSYSYSFDVALPDWCYGHVAVAHAIRFVRGGMPIYYGGPLWQLTAGELTF